MAGAILLRPVEKAVASLIVVALLSRVGFGQERSAIPAFPTRADAITADVPAIGTHGLKGGFRNPGSQEHRA